MPGRLLTAAELDRYERHLDVLPRVVIDEDFSEDELTVPLFPLVIGDPVDHMPKMKSIGVREFRDHATTYLSGSDPVAVSKHGHVIGFYIPLERDEGEVRRAVVRLGEAVEQVLKETGMSEEELAGLFDLRRALPE